VTTQTHDDSMRRAPLLSARKRLFMASLLFAFLFASATWIQAAGCALLLLLFNTLILPWLDIDVSKPPRPGSEPSKNIALSLGERVASGASRVRGYLVRLGILIPHHTAGGPSAPSAEGLVKAPDAIYPLPLGEGEEPFLIAPDTPTGIIRRVAQTCRFLACLRQGGNAIAGWITGGAYIPTKDVGTYAPPTASGIILYPISLLVLITLYRNYLHVAAAAWAIMALGDGMATVVGGGLSSSWRYKTGATSSWRGKLAATSWQSKLAPTLPWNRQKTWPGFISFVVAGAVGAYILTRWIAPKISPGKTLIVCAAAALLGAVVESFPLALDDNITVPLVVGAFLFCAFLVERSALDSNLPFLGRRILLAIPVNLVLALLAWALKAASRSGAICGFLLGTAIYLGYGYKSFLLLFALVLLGSAATRLGFAKKAARGVAERRGGARSWRQALANLLAAASFAILVITTHHEAACLIALVAALAEAAGDTVSSEIGQWASDRAYLITTFKPVPAGEVGGVSLAGTAAGFAASTIIMGLGLGLGLCGPYRFAGPAIALAAAAVGNLFDSFLGATLQRRGLVTNGMVNFAGTSVAGGLALGLALHLGL